MDEGAQKVQNGVQNSNETPVQANETPEAGNTVQANEPTELGNGVQKVQNGVKKSNETTVQAAGNGVQNMNENGVQAAETTVQEAGNGKKRRFWELDFIRGLCVVLMVFDHVMFLVMYAMPELGAMLGTDKWDAPAEWISEHYWMSDLRICVRFPVLFLFFLICGISCTLSRSNAKRGGLCFAVAMGVTAVTVLVDMVFGLGVSIYFGVLHMLGIAMLLYAALDLVGELPARLIKDERKRGIAERMSKFLAPTVGLVLLIVFFTCFFGGIIGDTFDSNVVIADKGASIFASFFVNIMPGVGGGTIGGADYWPLLPWAAIVLVGGLIGRLVYKNERIKFFASKLDGKWNKPICFVGRHALLIYVCHQVVALVVLFVVTLFMLI